MSEVEQSSQLGKAVYSEQIKLLYSCSKYRPALHIISAFVVVLIVIDSVQLTYIATWTLALIVFNIYRIIDISNTQKYLDDIDDFRSLQKHFVLLVAGLGLIYGLSITFIFHQTDALKPTLYSIKVEPWKKCILNFIITLSTHDLHSG